MTNHRRNKTDNLEEVYFCFDPKDGATVPNIQHANTEMLFTYCFADEFDAINDLPDSDNEIEILFAFERISNNQKYVDITCELSGYVVGFTAQEIISEMAKQGYHMIWKPM